MASTISVLTVPTRTLIKGTMTLIDLATAGLPNISVKFAVRNLCSIPRKGDTSRMASAPSNVLNRLHFNISCGNAFYVKLSFVCYRLAFILTVIEKLSFCCKCGNKHEFEVDQLLSVNSK